MRKTIAAVVFSACLQAQMRGADLPAKTVSLDWPNYYGDYTGQRHSPLSQINRGNVRSLSLAWAFTPDPAAFPTFEGLERGHAVITSVPLKVGNAVYFTIPDNVWALDAQTGRQIWHYYRPAPGNHAINLGVAVDKSRIFFGTADAHVVALDARNGKKIWDVSTGDVKFGEAVTMAPIVIRDHVIVGSSGEGADVPGYVIALDPETGKAQWKWNAVPRSGQPGSETWPPGKAGESIMARGGGHPSMTPTYDSVHNLLYVGTGSPRPVFAGSVREGDNLYTSSIVALNPDSGKMAWHYQTTPHDTHGWDAVATPLLVDAEFQRRPCNLLLQANRNGRLFVLDRITGENLSSTPFVEMNWPNQVNDKGQSLPHKEKEPRPDGVVAPAGATDWRPPSYNPTLKLLYVTTHLRNYALFYLLNGGAAPPRERAGVERIVGSPRSTLEAIEYQTGKIRWSSEAGGLGGVLSTAGGVIFSSGPANNVVALDAETGSALWHARIGAMTNSAISYEVGGRQFVITPVGGTVYSWTLPR